MKRFINAVQTFLRDEEGVTAIEYGLIAALIAVVIIVALGTTGNALNQIFEYIGDTMNNAVPKA